MTTLGHIFCASCGAAREPIDLLRVVDRTARESTYYVCRPNRGGLCFARTVGPADRWVIELAAAPSGQPGPIGPDEHDAHEAADLARIQERGRRRSVGSMTW